MWQKVADGFCELQMQDEESLLKQIGADTLVCPYILHKKIFLYLFSSTLFLHNSKAGDFFTFQNAHDVHTIFSLAEINSFIIEIHNLATL